MPSLRTPTSRQALKLGQADDPLRESGPREHDVPFVLHRAPWVGFAHYSRSCPPLSLSCVHVHVHVVLLTLAWSWQLMFRVCAPARAGLLCALRVLFVHLLHSSFVFVHLMHLDARLYRAKRVLMDARIAVEVAHHAYDWCTWRKSAIGHLCSRIWPRPYLNACGWRGDSRVAHITHHTGTWAHTRGPGSVLT